jgi:hypothetical protein
MDDDTDDVEYAAVGFAQQRTASEGRVLRCARCKRHEVTAEARVCPSCLVELRAASRG